MAHSDIPLPADLNGKSGTIRRGEGPQIVYSHVRGEILSARLVPGSRIDEASIAKELGLSRTPVRQALMRLATEGLLEISPNQSARVPPLNLDEVHSFLEAYEYLMRSTTYLCAKHCSEAGLELIRANQKRFEIAAQENDVSAMIDANEAFHMAIARAGKNSELARFMADLLSKTLRFDSLWYRRQSLEDAALLYRRSCLEHAEIVDMIERRNPEGSMVVVSRHVQSFRAPFMDYLASSDAAKIRPRS